MAGVVFVTLLVAAAAASFAAGLSPIIFLLAAVSGLAMAGLVVWRSQRDLRKFKAEHGRWPFDVELDDWNRELAGRREKARRVAAATDAAKSAAATHTRQVAAAERQFNAAQHARRDAIVRAQKQLQAAEQTHAAAVAYATTTLESWRNPGRGNRIASFKGIEVYQHVVKSRRGEVPIRSVQAIVAGNALTIQVGGLQDVFRLQAKEIPIASQFVAQLTLAANAEFAFEQQRPSAIPTAERTLAEVVADTRSIDSARAGVSAAEADPILLGAIHQAAAVLQATKADTADVSVAEANLAAHQAAPVQSAVVVPPPTWAASRRTGAISLIGVLLAAAIVGAIGAIASAAQAPSTGLTGVVPLASTTAASSPTVTYLSTPAASATGAATPAPTSSPAISPSAPASRQPTIAPVPTAEATPEPVPTILVTVGSVRYTAETFVGGTMYVNVTVTNSGSTSSPPLKFQFGGLDHYADLVGCVPTCSVDGFLGDLYAQFSSGLSAGQTSTIKVEFLPTAVGVADWSLSIYVGDSENVYFGTGSTVIR